ncbi:MAG: acyl-CoA thioesterase [Janthinobacterium lividum]
MTGIPPNYKFKTPIYIRFSDLDGFGHVNNAVYLTYFEIARTNYWKQIIEWDWKETNIILGKSEINYLKPLKLYDPIFCYVRTSRIGNSSFDMDYIIVKLTETGEEQICTTGQTVCIHYDYKAYKSIPIPELETRKMMEFEGFKPRS